MARTGHCGQSLIEACIALALFAAIVITMGAIYSDRTFKFEGSTLSTEVR